MTRWPTCWSRYLMKTFDDDWQLVILIEMVLDVVMDMEVDKVADEIADVEIDMVVRITKILLL